MLFDLIAAFPGTLNLNPVTWKLTGKSKSGIAAEITCFEIELAGIETTF